jgi:putative transcriptional regulator
MHYNSLKGQLLIAMPGMPDPRFANTVSLICYHNAEGAMALILNRLVGTLRLDQVLDNLKSDIHLPAESLRVHLGGPVANARGFILHGHELRHRDSHDVTDDVSLNATTEVLEKLIAMGGDIPYRFALGCASWSAGQLEDELRQGAWITAPAARDLIFASELPMMWKSGLAAVGIHHPEMLVSEMGNA